MKETSVAARNLARLLGRWRLDGPAYVGLASALRSLVLGGRIPLRARLPSERDLATALAVSRTTTTAAYDVLREAGYIESRRGSGSRVALPTGGTLDRELVGRTDDASERGIDLTMAALPAPGAMLDVFEEAVGDLSGHLGGSGYDPRGILPLRRAVATLFSQRGVPTVPEEIVITAGAQHGLRLVLDVVAAPGDTVLVESPSYPNAFEALRRAGASFVPVPMRDDGWDLRRIEDAFRRSSPRLAYLIPDFQNPTGLLMGDEARAAATGAAHRVGSHVVVDETFAQLDLEPSRRRPAPMAAHDPHGRAITVGSMSKAYWGGLRVGWIRCGAALADRIAHARFGIDLASPILEQLVAQRLLESGHEVLSERRALVAARRDALVEALRRSLPSWTFRVPRGGLCLWAEIDVDSRFLADAAEAEGVRILPGSTFTVDGTLDHHIRIPFTQPPEVLEDAVKRLAAAVARSRGLSSATSP